MRHLKDKVKLGRTTSHKRCLMANMLKALITQERIETTEPKAKELRRHAERMVTLAKRYHQAVQIEENKSGTPEEIAKAVAAKVALQRLAKARMMIRLNTLTAKEKKDGTGHNVDREVLGKLFKTLGPRFMDRNGGYTRIMKHRTRVGDGAALCLIEYVDYAPTKA